MGIVRGKIELIKMVRCTDPKEWVGRMVYVENIPPECNDGATVEIEMTTYNVELKKFENQKE